MLYSVRMRSAQGGDHKQGGRHISGAERLVKKEDIQEISRQMMERALSHSRGAADFINVVVEQVDDRDILYKPLLAVGETAASDAQEGRKAAQQELIEAGVKSTAAFAAIQALLSLPESMRGAMLVCAETGCRLDDSGARGIRVSRMDAADETDYIQYLQAKGTYNTHLHEALLLASKVASAPGILAELCWSDDPEYTTGYVASAKRYLRVHNCKPYGSLLGGRVFFVRPGADVKALTVYLQEQPVLIAIPKGEEQE